MDPSPAAEAGGLSGLPDVSSPEGAGDCRSPPVLRVWERPLLWLATGFGLGYVPIASGTFGSLWGPPLVWGLTLLSFEGPWLWLPAVILALIGVPICSLGVRYFGDEDPSQVVFDEIAAFPIVMAFVPFTLSTAAGGFVLFRVCDVLKPWPCRTLEHLPRGWGVLLDDLMAGLYAGLLLWGITSLLPAG